jgi:hypothetical protein
VRAVDHLDATVRGRLAAVAAALQERVDDITKDVEHAIQDAIPEFAGESAVGAFREASIGANVSTMLRLVSDGIDSVDVVAPDAALAYARRLAEQRAAPAVIVRCYRVGQSRFLRHCLEELSRQEVADGVDGRQADHVASIVLIDHISDFIDRVLDQVLAAYEAARDPNAAHPNGSAGRHTASDLDAEAAAMDRSESGGAVSRFGRPRGR